MYKSNKTLNETIEELNIKKHRVSNCMLRNGYKLGDFRRELTIKDRNEYNKEIKKNSKILEYKIIRNMNINEGMNISSISQMLGYKHQSSLSYLNKRLLKLSDRILKIKRRAIVQEFYEDYLLNNKNRKLLKQLLLKYNLTISKLLEFGVKIKGFR